MRHFGILVLVLSSTLGTGTALAQKQPAAALMAVDAAGNLGGDLDEPSGVPDTILTIDISGVESWDLLDDPDNTVLIECLGESAFMTGIGWNVTLTTNGASWLSEAVTYFDGQDLDSSGLFLTVGAGNNAPGSMNFDSGGILDLTDNMIPNIPIGDDDNLYMQFFESFDDVSDAVDSFYEDGSVYDIAVFDFGTICTGEFDPAGIPTLNTFGLIALMLLLAGLGMLFLKRQLRHQA
ncbi:MAG: hypothetical protein V3T72_12590 [Thermoanaerobaculia bacterium]